MSECNKCISEPNLEVWIILERTNLDSLVQSSRNKYQPLNIL